MRPRPGSFGPSLGIRPGEGGRVLAVAALFALVEAGRALGEVGVETLVQGRFGPAGLPSVLPWLYMALGALGLVVAVVFGAALGRVDRGRLFVAVLGLAAGVMVLGWLALPDGSDAALVGLWLAVALVASLLMTITWTMAGATFDARQARRIFPLLTAAAIAGGFVGSLAAGPLTALLGAADLVVLEAAALAIAVPLVAALSRRTRSRRRPAVAGSIVDEMRRGMDTVRASPLLRRIAACYVLLAVLMFSIQYPFTVAVATALPTDAERATALGILSAAVTATSFLVSAFVARRVYARFGVSAGAVLLPVVYLVGFGVWLAWFTFPTAMAVRFAQQVAQRGISNASWSAFYNVVPAERRAQVIAFNDGVPGQLGTILSGILLLLASRALAPDIVSWLGLAIAAITTVLVLGIRRGYGRSLVAALRSGTGERLLEGGPGVAGLVHDPSVRTALLSALEAPEPGVREVAARLLGEAGPDGDTTWEPLVVATRDADARVRLAALGALARLGAAAPDADPGGPATHPDLESLSSDPDARVRAAAIVARAGNDTDMIVGLAADPDAAVRATALAALTPSAGARMQVGARAVAISGLHDPAGQVRAAAAAALGADDTSPSDLIDELGDRRDPSTPAVLHALARLTARIGQDPAIRAPVLAFADARLARLMTLRSARRALGDGVGETPRFLADVLRLREQATLTDLLGALAVLGAPEASGLVRRCLGSTDPDIRAQAIEALESLGDPRLARRVSALLDEDPARVPGGQHRGAVLDGLAHDDDPWLRRLAHACLEDGAVTDTTRTMTELETMLALRRVPLFEGLDPEDLQRIAAYAVERSYAAGEVLMAEGDPSDELVVLLGGGVRVERAEPDGTSRFLRTYAAGEHIGELAVPRERPRAATVTADAEGARGLVVPGLGLREILRERPEAAMAMLATLAERLSRQ
ncbi:MAG: HEAT repeat domain-containing protein [Candidatus Limnocylindrales bacterium]